MLLFKLLQVLRKQKNDKRLDAKLFTKLNRMLVTQTNIELKNEGPSKHDRSKCGASSFASHIGLPSALTYREFWHTAGKTLANQSRESRTQGVHNFLTTFCHTTNLRHHPTSEQLQRACVGGTARNPPEA